MFGHEFLELEINEDGRMRYSNSSNYKSDTAIKREVYLGNEVLDEIKSIVKGSGIIERSDEKWPRPDNSDGFQKFEVNLESKYRKYTTSKIGSYSQVENSDDPEGLGIFYYLIQDIKCLVFSLISLNFRVKPV